jgi:replicative DNA helicase
MEDSFVKKKLPYNTDAERSVIGSMIMDRDAIVECSDMLVKEDFYNGQYGVLFENMVELFKEGKAVDLVTLKNKLEENNIPDEVISSRNIADIIDAVPTSANARHYANIVADKSMLRKTIKLCENVEKDCYLDSEGVDELLETAESGVFNLIKERNGSNNFVEIDRIVMNVIDQIEEASRLNSRITGIPTGFIDLDNMLTGLHGSELILVAARPAMGKTAFVLNIAHHVAVKKNIATAIFSLEMSKEQLVTRMIAMDSLVDSQKVQTGQLMEDDWDRVMDSAEKIAAAPLFIEDSSAITISELRSKCRKLKSKNKLGIVIIDYLQLMSTTKRVESRQQFISDMSRSLKMLARELDVPVIALSQLNRAVDSRPDHKPVLADLRESGAIEQDADVVMFIYRDDYYNPDTDKKGIAEIIIAKQRKGSTGSVDLVWLQEYTKFANKEH